MKHIFELKYDPKINYFKWLCEAIRLILETKSKVMSTAFQDIGYDRRSFMNVYHKVVVRGIDVTRGSHSENFGHILQAFGGTISVKPHRSTQDYRPYSLYNPFDEYIIALCHPNWVDEDLNPIEAIGHRGGPVIVDGERSQIQVSKKEWNKAILENRRPAPKRPLRTLNYVCKLWKLLKLDIKIELPEDQVQIHSIGTSSPQITPGMTAFVGTFHGKKQLSTMQKYPFYYPIRFEDVDPSLTDQNLNQTCYLFAYAYPSARNQNQSAKGKSNPQIAYKKKQFHIFEVELLPGEYSREKINVHFGHRPGSDTKTYRVLRIKSSVSSFLPNQGGDISQLVGNDYCVKIVTFEDLVRTGLGTISYVLSQPKAAQGDNNLNYF